MNGKNAGIRDDSAANENANDCANLQDQTNYCNLLRVNVEPYDCIEQSQVQSGTPALSSNETEKADTALRLDRQCSREHCHGTPDLLDSKENQYSNILLSSMQDLTRDLKTQYAKPVPEYQRLLDIHGLDSVRKSRYKQGTDAEHEYDTLSPITRQEVT